MRQKLVSIGDDYWIEDEQGQRVFKVNGKAMRIRDTLVLEDASGNELLKLQERKLRVRDTMEIEDRGRTVATVKKALISPLRERFRSTWRTVRTWRSRATSSTTSTRSADGAKAAEVSKKWFRVADTYGVEVADGQNAVLLLAVTAVIDQLTHDVG